MEISLRFLTEPEKPNLYLKDVDVETQLIIAADPHSTWTLLFISAQKDEIKCEGFFSVLWKFRLHFVFNRNFYSFPVGGLKSYFEMYSFVFSYFASVILLYLLHDTTQHMHCHVFIP